MLRNYFRLALRHLLRDKLHTVINIGGLVKPALANPVNSLRDR